ncbi:MAG: holo-ACP synthase [Eubacteriaceae bacterium]|nr:holo-ACP synthase [Eubacteriaceae bacterium]
MIKSFDNTVGIRGVGIDMTAISRYTEMPEEKQLRFAKFVLSEDELEKYESSRKKDQQLAVYFCAKEAVSKALGTGFAGVAPRSIILREDEKGRPFICLRDSALKTAEKLGITAIHVSVTHETGTVAVIAIAE